MRNALRGTEGPLLFQFRHPDSGHGSQRPPAPAAAEALCVQDRIVQAAKGTHAYSTSRSSVLGRFESINRARLHRIREALGPEQVRFFDVLPLLFHVNRPGLPGYVSRETPAGIKRFALAPRSWTRRCICSGARSGRARRRSPVISSGSTAWGAWAASPSAQRATSTCGSATSPASRRDGSRSSTPRHGWSNNGLRGSVWRCISSSSTPSASATAGTRGSARSAAAMPSITSFLTSFIDRAWCWRALCPMWWRVPPAEEHRYAECVAGLQAVPPEMPCVDLGGLGEVPREEYAGAALWQLGKVIDAPYKSVLKLLLLEAYAGEYPGPISSPCVTRRLSMEGLPMPRPSIRIGSCTAGSKSTSKGRPMRDDWHWPGAACTSRRKRRNAIFPRTWPGPGVGGSSRGSADNGAGRARTPRGSQSGIDGASIG